MPSDKSTEIHIGYVPLLDAAPLIVAQEAGFFKHYGVTVNLVREHNWASIRDKLSLGMLDGAHMLAPMMLATQMQPHRFSLKTALALGYNGNALTLSNRFADDILHPAQTLEEKLQALRSKVMSMREPLQVGTVFLNSMHTFLIRLMMQQAEIPMERIQIRVVPPMRMVSAMENGDVDLFCVGEPWNTAAQIAKAGHILCYGSELWSHAPEKVLAMRTSFIDQQPDAHKQMLKGLVQACQWLEEPDHKAQAALWIAGESYLNCSSDLLIRAMVNQWCGQSEPTQNRKVFFSEYANAPWPAHARWIAEAIRRNSTELPVDTEFTHNSSYDWTLFSEIMHEMGLPIPDQNNPPGVMPDWLR